MEMQGVGFETLLNRINHEATTFFYEFLTTSSHRINLTASTRKPQHDKTHKIYFKRLHKSIFSLKKDGTKAAQSKF